MKISFTGHIHGSKEDAWGQVRKACDEADFDIEDMDRDAQRNVLYWQGEISLQCELDTETGNVEIVGVDGHPIDKMKRLIKK